VARMLEREDFKNRFNNQQSIGSCGLGRHLILFAENAFDTYRLEFNMKNIFSDVYFNT
jgi:hypothetical protein